ncbi:hypothetical protein A3Q32_15760 [Alcanivorax sp. KX64203]|nr:hypothetical protein A3Q32_15760 [Alcanivorax sp. KX64203]
MSILTSEALFRRLFFQWGLLLLIALAATGWLASRDFVQLNASVYDRLIAWSDKPVNDDILIVAVDDRSLREIGRWPWSRLVHAALVDRLREAGVQAVMMDILFLEAEGDGKAGPAPGPSHGPCRQCLCAIGARSHGDTGGASRGLSAIAGHRR